MNFYVIEKSIDPDRSMSKSKRKLAASTGKRLRNKPLKRHRSMSSKEYRDTVRKNMKFAAKSYRMGEAKRKKPKRVRNEPNSMMKLIRHYGHKRHAGGHTFRESAWLFWERWEKQDKAKRMRRLLGVRKVVNRAVTQYHTSQKGPTQKKAKEKALRGMGVLSRQVPKLKGDKGGRSRSALSKGKAAKVWRGLRSKIG